MLPVPSSLSHLPGQDVRVTPRTKTQVTWCPSYLLSHVLLVPNSHVDVRLSPGRGTFSAQGAVRILRCYTSVFVPDKQSRVPLKDRVNTRRGQSEVLRKCGELVYFARGPSLGFLISGSELESSAWELLSDVAG